MDFAALLAEGIESWNYWRSHHPTVPCTLERADLSGRYLFECDLSGANLRGANLRRACLIGADLRWADLTNANLSGAYLGEANFYGAKLNGVDFTDASLERADLRRVHRSGRQMDASTQMAQMSNAVKQAVILASEDVALRGRSQVTEESGLSADVRLSAKPRRLMKLSGFSRLITRFSS